MDWLIAFGKELYIVYWSFCRYLSLSLGNHLNPILLIAVVVPLLLIIIPILLTPRAPAFTRHSLVLMPILWVVAGLWGAIFRDRQPVFTWPDYISYPLWGITIVFIIFGIGAIYRNQDYRAATVFLFVTNLYFMLAMLLLANMSVSAKWF